ncbi:MAG: hypothetical protein ACYDAO_04360 [Thermoplasmataceae archaeon]
MNKEELKQLVENGKKKKLVPVEVGEADLSPTELYRMKQREKQLNALFGESGDSTDIIDKEIAKALRDLRISTTFKMLKDNGDSDTKTKESPALKALQDQVADLAKQLSDERQRREREIEQSRQEKKFEDFKNEIIKMVASLSDGRTKTPNEINELSKKFDEFTKATEEEQRKKQNDAILSKIAELQKATKDNIEVLEDRISNNALYQESPKTLKDFAKELAEQKQVFKDLGMWQDKVKEGDENIVETILDKAPKVSESIRSIHDMWAGRDEDDDDDDKPAYKPPVTQIKDVKLHTQPMDADIAEYFRKGKEITDPDSGELAWVDQYGMSPTDATGRPLPKSEVEVYMRTQPDAVRVFREENRTRWEAERARQMASEKPKAKPQKEAKSAPEPQQEEKPEEPKQVEQAEPQQEEEPEEPSEPESNPESLEDVGNGDDEAQSDDAE